MNRFFYGLFLFECSLKIIILTILHFIPVSNFLDRILF